MDTTQNREESKDTMVSFQLSTPVLNTIDDLRGSYRGRASRSSILRELVNMGLRNWNQCHNW